MFEEEPEPLDENAPEVQEEIWETMKSMGIEPDELSHPSDGANYAEWLNSN